MITKDLSNLYVSESFGRLVQIDPNDGKSALYATGSNITGFFVSGNLETSAEMVFNTQAATRSIYYDADADRLAIKEGNTETHSFINTVQFADTDPVDPPISGDSVGYGTLYINTGSKDIFIWI
jgi:hypothetical protein